jgi:hypothetical protein
MNYIQLLNELTERATKYISEQISQKKKIVLFSKCETEDEEWAKDIYEDIPDFEVYGFANSAEWAAVMEIRQTEDNRIEIHGILKGDSYPVKTTIVLDELPSQCILYLADYLSNNCRYPRS